MWNENPQHLVMANPNPSFLTKQLINRVVALYLYEHPDCSVDDLVIAAATPAIHTKFKEIDPKNMYSVMLRMKHFVSRHSRFKNFTKEAAADGLRKEWLCTSATAMNSTKNISAVTAYRHTRTRRQETR